MLNANDADHALGIELQIEELVERRERARVQRRFDDAASFEEEITALHLELADIAERDVLPDGASKPVVRVPGPAA